MEDGWGSCEAAKGAGVFPKANCKMMDESTATLRPGGESVRYEPEGVCFHLPSPNF
jgi:hypothetical protein